MQVETFQQFALYQWLAANPDWLGLALLVTAFLESFAVVGIAVPGVLILSAFAFLAGTGLLELPTALLYAFFGAVLGDGCSYLIGRRFQDSVREWPVLRDNREWLRFGEQFFERYGVLGIVIGRFLGPIRPVIPLVAGMLKMRPPLFFAVNLVSAIAWAPAYVLPGYALGASMEMAYSSTELVLMGAGGMLVIAGFYYGIRHLFLKEDP